MDEAPLEPGAQLNEGAIVPPRVAATVIVLRDGAEGLEVLLVQRNPRARFMGGTWVFPGGAVDPADGEGEDALRWAAMRELAEEASIRLAGPEHLVAFSRWITPAELAVRFDTWFFLASLPPGAEPRVDGSECVDLRWIRPGVALDEQRARRLDLVFPTIRHLERMAPFASVNELLGHALDEPVPTVMPRVVGDGGATRVVLPGEPGYGQRRI